MSGLYDVHGEDAAAKITSEFLEALAVNQDRERRSVLARVQRPPVPGPDPLSNYVGVSLDADKALEEGFFAPDAERAELWAGAFRLLSLIDTDARFQPAPSGNRWTAAHCAEAVARHRESLAFLRQLARGDFPAEPLRRHLGASAYFALPSKPGGETPVTLPALAAEFALDVPTNSAPTSAPRPPKSRSPVPTDGGEGSEQLPLL